MSGEFLKRLLACLHVSIILKVKYCSSEEDFDKLNFDVFQETSGKGACPQLLNPANGRYDCIESHGLGVSPRLEGNKTCTLKCDEGFVLPIVQKTPDGTPLLLENIGVYKCFSDPGQVGGRREWVPKHFFECIPTRHPIECRQFFFIPLATTDNKCYPQSAVSYENKFRAGSSVYITPYICLSNSVVCSWDFHVRCNENNTMWTVTVIMSWPFNKDFVKQQNLFRQAFFADVRHIRVRKQKHVPTQLTDAGATNFQVTCPPGTRFSRDFLCHGCSKGNFMNDSMTECQPCPARFFQDNNLQVSCKACPQGSSGARTGGAHVTSCYKMDELLQETDFLTMAFCLSTVVSFIFALIIFNNQVNGEDVAGKSVNIKPIVSVDTQPTGYDDQLNKEISATDFPSVTRTLPSTHASWEKTIRKYGSRVDSIPKTSEASTVDSRNTTISSSTREEF